MPEMTFKGHSKSSAMSSFVRSPARATETTNAGYTYFQKKVAEMAMAQFSRPHITFSYWSP